MLTDLLARNVLGRITKYLEPNASIVAVVKFVENHLPEFATRAVNYKGEKNLTDCLVNLLSIYTHREKCAFHFIKDDPQDKLNSNSPTVDIGVRCHEIQGIAIDDQTFGDEESFFSFEAKRLKRISRPREKEYLIGRYLNARYLETGGIERFKKQIHGRKLKYSGIIGYMQERDYRYWKETLNQWIDEITTNNTISSVAWNEEDKLVEENVNITARYKSINIRTSGDKIILFHLWINLQVNQPRQTVSITVAQ